MANKPPFPTHLVVRHSLRTLRHERHHRQQNKALRKIARTSNPQLLRHPEERDKVRLDKDNNPPKVQKQQRKAMVLRDALQLPERKQQVNQLIIYP